MKVNLVLMDILCHLNHLKNKNKRQWKRKWKYPSWDENIDVDGIQFQAMSLKIEELKASLDLKMSSWESERKDCKLAQCNDRIDRCRSDGLWNKARRKAACNLDLELLPLLFAKPSK